MLPVRPMRLLRMVQPFDDSEWLFELKIDGFRGLAFIDNARCRLLSRNGHALHQWDTLKREIAASIRCQSAVIDGEIACLDSDGRSNFYALIFRRRTRSFVRSTC
jgi:bifunctional non-homologous end joining protein LigD